ncbi:YhcN/YlaJ family sporulation lipoprotein [Terribacillus sp. AE2B 122]|jgi:spore cortex protein|uniref:YhcN/YlaJ family sporulation lipoprotein n=1 Tax=Terribacillus TaxID=459532 RepID=UPI00158140D2|nr:YhcN/YlaJ family sporulation lipoprotein [Terribacillus sp. AE2B 122]
MKKWKLISMAALAAITLTACQNNDDKDNGMGNVEPTRYNNTDNNLVHRNSDNTRDVDDRQKNGDDQQPRYQVADDVAKKVEEVEGVDRAYVFTTDNNAFVAVDMKDDNNNGNNGNNGNSGNNGMGNTATGDNNNNEVTDKMKKDVEKAVKSVDEDIDNVYVSADPDFLGMAEDYNNKIDEGQPVKGFFLEFGNMLNRVFPNNER